MPVTDRLLNLLTAGTTVAAFGVGALVYARRVEPTWLDVTDVPVTLPRLDPEFDGYRIVQISDLHMELWRRWDVLDEAIDQANAVEPDLVAITGDFVERRVADIGERLAQALRRLKPRDAVVGVLGNHDYWHNAAEVVKVMQQGGVLNISNGVYTVRRGDAMLHIAGVDTYLGFQARLDRVLECLPDEGASILLAHEPDFAFVSAPTRRFDLQLSGHSHGGQIRVPFLMDLALPKFAHRFVNGLDRAEDMLIYTNRGLGMTNWQLRFNCRPELTVLTLHAP